MIHAYVACDACKATATDPKDWYFIAAGPYTGTPTIIVRRIGKQHFSSASHSTNTEALPDVVGPGASILAPPAMLSLFLAVLDPTDQSGGKLETRRKGAIFARGTDLNSRVHACTEIPYNLPVNRSRQ